MRQAWLWIGGAALFFLAIAALAPGTIAPGDPLAIHPAQSFRAPSIAHLFGTDESGRDIFTRIIHGTGLEPTGSGRIMPPLWLVWTGERTMQLE